MEGAEEGECSSEDEIVQYVPLERPIQAKPSARIIPGKSVVFLNPVRSSHHFSGSVFIFCGVSDSKNPGQDLGGLKVLIKTEAESKEKHGVWDLMPELKSPFVDSRMDSNTCTMGNPKPESTLSLSQRFRIRPLKISKKFHAPVLKNMIFFLEGWKHLR
jgi:hypothetical protein